MRYRWFNKESGTLVIEVVRSIDDRDIPPSDQELREEDIDIDVSLLVRKLETPVISKRHIPAMGKGSRLVRDGNFRDLREAQKLENEAYDMPDSERTEITKVVKKLRKEP